MQLNLEKNSDELVIVTVDDLESAESVAEAYFALKRNKADSDASALVFLTITTALTSSGQITNTGSGAADARLEFMISNSALTSLEVGMYYWGVKIKNNVGKYRSLGAVDFAWVNEGGVSKPN